MTLESRIEISLQQYKNAGGLEGAINQDAENVFGGFPNDQTAIAKLFQRITEKGEGERPIRKPETLSVLAKISGVGPEGLREIVDAFAERDLLVLRKVENGETQVDLPHECLGWKWKRLASWIDEEAALAKSLDFVKESASKEQWLTGSALAEAQQLREAQRLDGLWPRRYLSETDMAGVQRWVDLSEERDKAERRRAEDRRRRARWWLVSVGIAALLLLVLFLFSWLSYTKATAENMRAQVAESQLRKKAEELNTFREQVLQGNGWSADHIKRVPPTSAIIDRSLEANNALVNFLGKSSPLSIFYYAKVRDWDRTVLLNYWKSLGYQVAELAAVNDEPTNVIWFREPVSQLDLKRVALSLIRAGIELRAIKPLSTPGQNAAFIGFDLEFSTHPLWTAAEIMKTENFRQARTGVNQAYVSISSPSPVQIQQVDRFLTDRGVFHTFTLNPARAVKTIATGLMLTDSAKKLAQEMAAKGISCEVRYP